MNTSNPKLPVIVCNIEGQFQQKNDIFGKVLQQIRLKRNNLKCETEDSQSNIQLPLIFFEDEVQDKTTLQNQEKQSKLIFFQKEFVQHDNSLYIPEILHFQEKQLILLITGELSEEEILIFSKIHSYYITVNEYIDIYPQINPLSKRKRSKQETIQIIKQRLNVDEYTFNELLQIHGIFILQFPSMWEQTIQIILDLLSTEDGKIATHLPQKTLLKHIPVYYHYKEISSKQSSFILPRINLGGFTEALKLCYELMYKQQLNMIMLRKQKVQIDKFEGQVQLRGTQKQLEVSKCYVLSEKPIVEDFKCENVVNIVINQQERNKELCVGCLDEAIELVIRMEGNCYWGI